MQCQGSMTGAGFEDFDRGLMIISGGRIRVDIEEGDDQVGIMRVDLRILATAHLSWILASPRNVHTGVTNRGVRVTYSSRVGRLSRTSGPTGC